MLTAAHLRRKLKYGIGIAALSLAAAFASVALPAQEANAAGCSYSNLTSTSVKNVNCSSGAYGFKSSANATVGTRVGAWVAAGKYSYNPNKVCYVYATMVHP